MFSFVLSLFLSYSSLAAATTKNIFILAGESNMSGRGGVINGTWDQIVPPECSPNPLILRLNAQSDWEEAKEPLHSDIDSNNVCGIGPGLAFANSILKSDSSIGTIGLVPCAIGGTKITEWTRGSEPYDQMVSQASTGEGKLRGIIWYQGESDALNNEDATLYETRLAKFFDDVRSDLESPNLPILQVVIAPGGPYADFVRQAQLDNKSPNVTTVDAGGLEREPNGLHLSTNGQAGLGKDLADAWLEITGAPPAHTSSLPEIP